MNRKDKEELILSELKSNFDNGFHLLFVEFYNPMRRFALKYVEDIYIEDIIQDVFMKIWERKVKISNFNQLKSYLYSSVYNKCIDLIRKNSSKLKYEGTLCDNDLCDNVLEVDLLSLLLDCIETLPEHYKEVINLSLKGETIEDIAVKMNTTPAAVKSYKQRAKTIMKNKLGSLSFIVSLFI